MQVHIWAERRAFSAWSSTRQPYFRPQHVETPAEASTSFTFFDTLTTPRATRLFEVATQHLLYCTLAEDPAVSFAKERYCGWGEVGFGQFVEQQLTGPAGRAQPQAWQMPIETGETWSRSAVCTSRTSSTARRASIHHRCRQHGVGVGSGASVCCIPARCGSATGPSQGVPAVSGGSAARCEGG